MPIYEIGDRYYWQIADTLYGRDFLVTTTLLKVLLVEKDIRNNGMDMVGIDWMYVFFV